MPPRWVLVGAGLLFSLATFASFTRGDPDAIDLGRALAAPSLRLPLGADPLGRDVWARVAAGGFRSLVVVMLYALVAVPGGVALGLALALLRATAGPLGFLLRAATAVPPFVLALVGTAAFGLSPVAAGLALGASGASHVALLVAVHARSCLRETWAAAAEALGADTGHMARWHLLPAVSGPLRARLGTDLSRAVVAYAGLAFIGLGADTSAPDWGALIWEYRAYVFTAPRLILGPVAAISCLALAIHLLLDPWVKRDRL